jgi:tetratricopeptide (TPR) repeat protein
MDPTNPEFLFFLGLGYERVGDSNEAREVYARGHERFPDYADLKLGLARLLVRSGSPVEARDMGLEVLDRDPDNVDALLVVGQAYRNLGELGRAKEYLSRGLQLKETYTDFHRQLAGIARTEGDHDALQFHCRKILEHEPDDAWARARLDELLGGGEL